MTAQETAALVAAILTLLGTVNAYLIAKSQQHDKALNSEMDCRIAAGAKAAVQNDHALRGEPPSPATNAATQARIAALRAELETLDPATAALVAAPAVAVRK